MSKTFTVPIGQLQFLEIEPQTLTDRIAVRRKDSVDNCVLSVSIYTPDQAEALAMALNESLMELTVSDAEKSWGRAGA